MHAQDICKHGREMNIYLRDRKRCHNTAFGRAMSAQYTGNGHRGLHQLPSHIINEMDENYDLLGILGTIQVLEEYSVKTDYDADDGYETMKDILGQLTQFDARQSDNVDELNKYAKVFLEYGGIEVLMRILMLSSSFPNESSQSKEIEPYLRVKSVISEILTRMCSRDIGTKVAKDLTKNHDLMNYLFTLFAHRKTYLTTCELVEDMLQARRSVFNLTTIDNIKTLIPCLDDEKLACFCRVLAICISDLDIYENKSSYLLLVGVPDLTTRLVKIACAKPANTPRYSGVGNELDAWMEWIDNSLSQHDAENPEDDDYDDFIGGISEPVAIDSPFCQQPGIRISNDLVQRVQVIYVIGLFLVGKHRKKIQRKLAELKLIPGLNELFDHFIWKCQSHRSSDRLRLRGHSTSCECSPEVALKIQFLRLVHAFCDHSEFKHLLLTKSELNEIKKINEKAGALKVANLDDTQKDLMCKGRKGLLSKIVDVMKKEPTASTFRFWLARAVESYLRGTTSYCDQMFLLRRGLLQHVAGNIVEHDIRPKEILQSSFDLLGELIKFNISAFKTFDKILDSDQKFNKFINTINNNLVDSNMFIRSLMLSYEHFMSSPGEHNDYAVQESRLLKYIGAFDRQLDYLHKLINTVNVEELTQENVSCLNTTLVFLMFANQKCELPGYLKGLRDEKFVTVHEKKGSLVLMKNFRGLLIFWQDHYLHKDKDCSALERSSRISFDYWKATVSTLVSQDRDKDTAIIFYLPMEMLRSS
ncbi:short transient receptor potential channel 4-associated protein-like isoform X2 [Lineus longissimus]|uniref:short transient receptor potential channel 4-associated protein-like isoform X2 n=1 Tax=Lineus longissimus TaxID=88925 RepID=UPI00315C736F